jgi:hypothetical protein
MQSDRRKRARTRNRDQNPRGDGQASFHFVMLARMNSAISFFSFASDG